MGYSKLIWTTTYGDKIALADMTDTHLKHAIGFVQRAQRSGLGGKGIGTSNWEKGGYVWWIKAFLNEVELREERGDSPTELNDRDYEIC